MPTYRTTGTLTGTIEPENLEAAQAYLREDAMVDYVARNADLVGVLQWIEWNLHADGHHYHITAVTTRELAEDELKRLSSECSGQNSDGLGEGFEQQPFAETSNGACYSCEGCENGFECEESDYGMISFDWQTNKLPFTKIA